MFMLLCHNETSERQKLQWFSQNNKDDKLLMEGKKTKVQFIPTGITLIEYFWVKHFDKKKCLIF